MKFIVDRKTWRRGESGSRLLSHDGKRCCIGFAASQLGTPDSEILEVSAVASKKPDGNPVCPLLCWKPNYVPSSMSLDWVYEAYQVNDDPKINDVDRERRLKELAESGGHEFEFIN